RMFIMSNTKEFSASYKGGAGIVADDGSAGLVASMGEVFLPSGYAREDGFALVDRNASDTLFQVSKHRITGDITAKFAGFNFNDTEFQSTNNTGFKTSRIYMDSAAEQFSLGDRFYYQEGAVSRLASAYFDDTDMWGGASNKNNASVRLDFDNGRLYYDAIVSPIYQYVDKGDESPIGNIQSFQDNMGANGTQNQTASFATNYRQIVKASYLHRYGFNRISYSFRVVISSNTTINGDANIGNLDVDILSTLELHEIDSAASYLTPMQTNKTSVNKNGSKEVFINYDVSIPSGAPEGKYLLPQLKIRVN